MKYNDNGTIKELKVKSFDTLPVGTEVDYDGSVVPDGWTEVADPNTYSTDEVRIGTWFGKPLYRKVFQYNDLSQISSGSYGVITTGLQNVRFVKFEVTNFYNNVSRLMPYNDGTNSLNIVSINNDIRIYINGTTWNDSANYLIISCYYTKTTD